MDVSICDFRCDTIHEFYNICEVCGSGLYLCEVQSCGSLRLDYGSVNVLMSDKAYKFFEFLDGALYV